MKASNALRAIWRKMGNNKQDIEISEELTNAYFGNQAAWQVSSDDVNQQSTTKEEP